MRAYTLAEKKQDACEVAFNPANEVFEDLKALLAAAETMQMTERAVERLVDERGRDVLRQLLAAHLALRSLATPIGPVKGADGVVRTHRRPEQDRELLTVFGAVPVERTLFGARGHTSLGPVDADLNLPPNKYSLPLQERLGAAAAKTSFDAAIETVLEATGVPIPKRQAEEITRALAVDFEGFYAARLEVKPADPATGSLMVLTWDGKGIIVHELDMREATQALAQQNKPQVLDKKFDQRRKAKKYRRRRATIGAVYTVAPYVRSAEDVVAALRRREPDAAAPARSARPRPEQKRVWASVVQEQETVIEEGFLEALRRDPNRLKTWVAVVDGDKAQLDTIRTMARKYGVKLVIVLDLMHVLKRLWKAGRVLHKRGSKELEDWVFVRLERILRGEALLVAAALRRSATKRKLDAATRRPMDKCARYIEKYSMHMRYDEYLARGFPIASGVAEGAVRHLCNDRMEITGARWRLASAEAVLRLRALWASGDLDDYWRFHEAQELRRTHVERYAEQTIPALRSPFLPAQLRLVG